MATATSKPLLCTLAGKSTWPPPVWLMRQAGRYLPEYRALRAKAGDFIALCTDPELAAEATLQPIRRFGLDAAILFSDILMLPWALGYGLAFKEGEGPVLPPFQDEAQLAGLDPTRLSRATAPIMQAVRQVRAGLAAEGFDRVALIGFAGAPFTVACYMIEGGGSKDFAATRAMAYGKPELFGRLMEVLTEATIAYLTEQVEAGAEVVMLFDSWAGVLSPTLFRTHVIAPAARIANSLKQTYPSLKLIGFPRLAGMMLGPFAQEAGCDAVAMDTGMDPALAAQIVPPGTVLQGNLDPLALASGGEALVRETRSILHAMRGRPFVFNLGHGIVPQTLPENVTLLVELIRAG